MSSMKIPLSQVLEDEDVKRTICQVVQAELERANLIIAEKNERIQSVESENLFLKGRISQLERDNKDKEIKMRELQRQFENERVREEMGGDKREKRLGQDTSKKLEESSYPQKQQSSETIDESEHQEDYRKCGWICMCGSKFDSREGLNHHLKYFRTTPKFHCTQCPTRFVFATDMRKHLRNVHKVQPEPWMKNGCRDCGSFFRQISDLFQHRRTAHVVTKKPSIERVKQEVVKELHGFAKQVKKSGSTKHLCHCGKEYMEMSSLKRHVKTMATKVNAKK